MTTRTRLSHGSGRRCHHLVAAFGLLFLSSANAWSYPSQPKLTCDRRNALKKAVAVSSSVGIALSGPKAEAAVSSLADPAIPPPRNNKNVYFPPLASLEGKVIVITGANTGLGLESAKRLAAAGATVLLTARTEGKGAKAVDAVRRYLADRSVGNSNVYAATLDLADLKSVRSFPDRYGAVLGSRRINVLMNNAGVAAIPEREVTVDGFERTFQTNHLAPFLLTALLFPLLDRNGSRVVNVSSYAHEFATLAGSGKRGLDVNNLNGEAEYSGLGWPAYCRSKLENILFTQEMQRQADAAGMDWLTVVALHPGRVATDIWRTTYFGIDSRGQRSQETGGRSIQSFVSDAFYDNVLPVEEGANTQVMLAASGEPRGVSAKAQYFDQNMKVKRLGGFARDEERARYLWDKSEELLGVKFRLN